MKPLSLILVLVATTPAFAGKRSATPSRAPAVTCFSADAVFFTRKDDPKKGGFLGYSSLTAAACTAPGTVAPLPYDLPNTGRVLAATSGAKWDRVEQDKLHTGDATTYRYHAFHVVFEDASAGGTRGPLPAIQAHNAWIGKLGDARPVFEQYYERRDLAHHQSDASWADDNVYKCFEALGHGDFCGAETAGQMHPSSASANPLPEALFCAAYGHLHHAAQGTSCHGPMKVAPGASKCVDRCQASFKACVTDTDNTGACGATQNDCTAGCFARK